MRYAYIIDEEIIREVHYDEPPEIKVVNGRPMLRPIVVKDAKYDPEKQTYRTVRTIKKDKVIEEWVIVDLPPEAINARQEARRAAEMPTTALVVDTLVQAVLSGDLTALRALEAHRQKIREKYPLLVQEKPTQSNPS